MTIGARVRSLREFKGWSQEDLAQASELQRPHISLIENNERTPGADSLAKLATALETSTDYLVGLTNDPSPRPIANNASLTDPRLQYIVRAWRFQPDYAREIFYDRFKFMEIANPHVRANMRAAGIEPPPLPEGINEEQRRFLEGE